MHDNNDDDNDDDDDVHVVSCMLHRQARAEDGEGRHDGRRDAQMLSGII